MERTRRRYIVRARPECMERAGFAVLVGAMLCTLNGCSESKPSLSQASPTATTASQISANDKARTGQVVVEQEPISVKREYFDRGSTQSKQVAEEHNQSANTHWKFQCVPKFRFDIVDKKTIGKAPDDTFSVKLRITNVNVFLAAPVTIYLPKQAKQDVVSHEDGHFKICKKVYDTNAKPAAQSAARALIGREFDGTGKSIELASQEALHHAAQDMGREFRSKTIDYLDRVSAYYDQLTPQHPESKYVDACVEAAFKAEEQVQARAQGNKAE